MSAVALGRQEALQRIRQALGLPTCADESGDVDLIVAEYLRTALSRFSTNQFEHDGGPVYVTRLTNAVQRQLAPLWPELYGFRDKTPPMQEQLAEGDISPDRVRRVLERLHDLRDVVELGSGYWLPAPVRFVAIPDTENALVIGGLGSYALRAAISKAIRSVGVARMIGVDQLPPHIQADRTKWQSFEDWYGEVPENLQGWTEALLQEASKRLVPSASNTTNFEVYAPWLNRRQPQFFRWMRFDELVQRTRNPLPKLVLCRSSQTALFRLRTYWIGVLDPNGLRQESPVAPAMVRRLVYGLDLLHEAPTEAVWQTGAVTLRNWLPPEEQRALFVFGRDVSAEHGRLPMRIEVEHDWQEWVAGLLSGLGIKSIIR